ncbi:conserved hypothetical protein [Chromobacterium violaceum ATCC 12472]|uniref:Uncharacterized protein n=1 Tax=Chromobacterium violaceum (strain ATCC 12472 / DSM 30191 / JCM 1249 / CCUG 213 / NBRC 12614 / NCIMB 9131 / NCTC 9757 / MK) TaxID=243365 RepID=Q7NVW9_CHRVO|nr:conserved hypothetical protein [Chromobacterium violaceum ATCC 12472]
MSDDGALAAPFFRAADKKRILDCASLRRTIGTARGALDQRLREFLSADLGRKLNAHHHRRAGAKRPQYVRLPGAASGGQGQGGLGRAHPPVAGIRRVSRRGRRGHRRGCRGEHGRGHPPGRVGVRERGRADRRHRTMRCLHFPVPLVHVAVCRSARPGLPAADQARDAVPLEEIHLVQGLRGLFLRGVLRAAGADGGAQSPPDRAGGASRIRGVRAGGRRMAPRLDPARSILDLDRRRRQCRPRSWRDRHLPSRSEGRGAFQRRLSQHDTVRRQVRRGPRFRDAAHPRWPGGGLQLRRRALLGGFRQVSERQPRQRRCGGVRHRHQLRGEGTVRTQRRLRGAPPRTASGPGRRRAGQPSLGPDLFRRPAALRRQGLLRRRLFDLAEYRGEVVGDVQPVFPIHQDEIAVQLVRGLVGVGVQHVAGDLYGVEDDHAGIDGLARRHIEGVSGRVGHDADGDGGVVGKRAVVQRERHGGLQSGAVAECAGSLHGRWLRPDAKPRAALAQPGSSRHALPVPAKPPYSFIWSGVLREM